MAHWRWRRTSHNRRTHKAATVGRGGWRWAEFEAALLIGQDQGDRRMAIIRAAPAF